MFFGFKLCYEGHRIATYFLNSQIEAVQSVLRAITLERVAGPFDNSPLYNLRLSTVGILPKSEVLIAKYTIDPTHLSQCKWLSRQKVMFGSVFFFR